MMPAPASGGSREVDPNEVIATGRLDRRPLFVLLDIDGTLAPIAPHPSQARVPADTRNAIAALASQPGLAVGLVSGRAVYDAHRLVGVDGVWTIGNHGAEVMSPAGNVVVNEAVARYAAVMADAARALELELAGFAGVVLENKRWTLSVHYREAEEAVVPELRDLVARVADVRGLRVTEGKKVLEVRPPVRVDKGSAIAGVVRDLAGDADPASLLFAGDDTTDEDAFRLLRTRFPNAVTIHVGSNAQTAAEFRFGDLRQVRVLLEQLARAMTLHQ